MLKFKNSKNKIRSGFTLIELLVVISIIAILVGVSIFGLAGARESSRDARRKSDLELIRSGLELYKADCNDYPASITLGGTLVGDNTPVSCDSDNVYISSIPNDPISGRVYRYARISSTTYELCSALEQTGPTFNCGGMGCGVPCNYRITNP